MSYPLPANAGFYVGSPINGGKHLWLGPNNTEREAGLHFSSAYRLLRGINPEKAPWIRLGVVRFIPRNPDAAPPLGSLNCHLDPESDAFRGLKMLNDDVRPLDTRLGPGEVVVEANRSTGAWQYALFRIRDTFPMPGETRVRLTLVDERGHEITRMHPTNQIERRILTPEAALDLARAFPNRSTPCDAYGEPIGLSEAEVLKLRVEAFVELHPKTTGAITLGD